MVDNKGKAWFVQWRSTSSGHEAVQRTLLKRSNLFKGSQGEQTDGTDDFDDVLRFSKDYTIRALTTSKAGGRFFDNEWQ